MWNYCVQHAIHIINRLPSHLLNSHTPYELLFKNPSSYMHLKVFSCLCYATYTQAHMNKFDYRARKSMFIGYKDDIKGFILYDLSNHEIFLSRNVIFYEFIFPFQMITQSPSPHSNPSTLSNHIQFLDGIPTITIVLEPIVATATDITQHANTQHTNDFLHFTQVGTYASSVPINITPDLSLSPSPISQNLPVISVSNHPLPIIQSTKISHLPSYLADYHFLQTTTNNTSLIPYCLS